MTPAPNRSAAAAPARPTRTANPGGPQCRHGFARQADRDDLRRRGDDADQRDQEQQAVSPVRCRLGVERTARRQPRGEGRHAESDRRQDEDHEHGAPRQPIERIRAGDRTPRGTGQAGRDDRGPGGHQDRHRERHDGPQPAHGAGVVLAIAGGRRRQRHETEAIGGDQRDGLPGLHPQPAGVHGVERGAAEDDQPDKGSSRQRLAQDERSRIDGHGAGEGQHRDGQQHQEQVRPPRRVGRCHERCRAERRSAQPGTPETDRQDQPDDVSTSGGNRARTAFSLTGERAGPRSRHGPTARGHPRPSAP